MKTHDIDAVVRGLDPHRATDQVSDEAWAELSDAITGAETAPVVSITRRSPNRLVLVAACTLLIAGVLGALMINRPHQNHPEALSFTQQGDHLIVRVVDPYADPKRYNEEFKRMGLDVTVLMVPVSPAWVGKLISYSGRDEKDMSQLKLLEAGEACNGTLNASDPGCQVGVELPKDYKGTTDIQFGRAAKPGEMYMHTSSHATDKGEILAGLTVKNKTVAQVLPLLKSRGVRAEYSVGQRSMQTVPGNWYVEDAVAFAQGEVTLYVSPTR